MDAEQIKAVTRLFQIGVPMGVDMQVMTADGKAIVQVSEAIASMTKPGELGVPQLITLKSGVVIDSHVLKFEDVVIPQHKQLVAALKAFEGRL